MAVALALLVWVQPSVGLLPPVNTSDDYVSNFNGDDTAVFDGSGQYLHSFTAAREAGAKLPRLSADNTGIESAAR